MKKAGMLMDYSRSFCRMKSKKNLGVQLLWNSMKVPGTLDPLTLLPIIGGLVTFTCIIASWSVYTGSQANEIMKFYLYTLRWKPKKDIVRTYIPGDIYLHNISRRIYVSLGRCCEDIVRIYVRTILHYIFLRFSARINLSILSSKVITKSISNFK